MTTSKRYEICDGQYTEDGLDRDEAIDLISEWAINAADAASPAQRDAIVEAVGATPPQDDLQEYAKAIEAAVAQVKGEDEEPTECHLEVTEYEVAPAVEAFKLRVEEKLDDLRLVVNDGESRYSVHRQDLRDEIRLGDDEALARAYEVWCSECGKDL